VGRDEALDVASPGATWSVRRLPLVALGPSPLAAVGRSCPRTALTGLWSVPADTFGPVWRGMGHDPADWYAPGPLGRPTLR
jgi:hypothetical protein